MFSTTHFCIFNTKIEKFNKLFVPWWPLPLGVIVDMKNCNPICKLCANWLPEKEDIEDIEDIIKDRSKINTKCINELKKLS